MKKSEVMAIRKRINKITLISLVGILIGGMIETSAVYLVGRIDERNKSDN